MSRLRTAIGAVAWLCRAVEARRGPAARCYLASSHVGSGCVTLGIEKVKRMQIRTAELTADNLNRIVRIGHED